jgi:hypothetical protein
MRTKTLLLTAVLSAAAAASSMADVFSVNVVGYVNVSVPAGFSMIANPLNNGDNTLQTVIPNAVDGTKIFKFSNGQFENACQFFGAPDNIWDPNTTINPGEGFFILSPVATNITFVGEVATGTQTNSYPAGFSIKSSIVPQSGGLSSVLGFPAQDGDKIYLFDTAAQTYKSADQFFGAPDNVWDPAEPTPAVGESFFVLTSGAANWVRTFNP